MSAHDDVGRVNARVIDIADAFAGRWFATRRRGCRRELELALAHCLDAFVLVGGARDANAIALPDEDGADDALRARAVLASHGVGCDGEGANALPSARAALTSSARATVRAPNGDWSFTSATCEHAEYDAIHDIIEASIDRELLARRMRAKSAVEEAEAEAEAGAKAARRAKMRATRAYVPRLREPTKSETKTFITSVAEALTGGENGTMWHPSFAKAKRAVEDVVTARGTTSNECVTALTEFVMMHLGGTKYRAKCFEDEAVEDAEDVAEGVEEDGGGAREDEVVTKVIDEAPTLGKRKVPEPVREIRDDIDVENGNGGVSLLVEDHDGYWQGRMRAVAPSAGEEVDGFRRYMPWWQELETMNASNVGRWGEMLVYNYLLVEYPANKGFLVEWLNAEHESNSFYDVKVTNTASGHVVYVEVKATRWEDKNAFEISPWEWDFAVKPGVEYHIYRVFNVGNKERVRVRVVRNPARLIREKKIGMALVI